MKMMQLKFEPRDPFPLINPANYSLAQLQNHSAEVDRWLGFKIDRVEKDLAEAGCRAKPYNASKHSQQLWFGLAAQDLLTPYVELRSLLEALNLAPGTLIADLGAAYGRLAFVIARHYPHLSLYSYEFVGERLIEARRVFDNFLDTLPERDDVQPSVRFQHTDLSSVDFVPVPADVFFVYDYGCQKSIEKTLYDIRRFNHKVLVLARGRHSRMLIESRHQHWLTKNDPDGAETRLTMYRGRPDLNRAGVTNPIEDLQR